MTRLLRRIRRLMQFGRMVVDMVAMVSRLLMHLVVVVDSRLEVAGQIGERRRCVTAQRLDARDFRVVRVKVVVLLMTIMMIFGGRLQSTTVRLAASADNRCVAGR